MMNGWTRTVPAELVPSVLVAVGLGHGFDGALAGGRYDRWQPDLRVTGGARSCEFTMFA